VPCLFDQECAAGQECYERRCCEAGKCAPLKPCKSDKECPARCNVPLGRCVKCLKAADCGAGQRCTKLGNCQPVFPCKSDEQCKARGMLCDKAKGACVGCVKHDDCPVVYHCSDGECALDACYQGQRKCVGAMMATCTSVGNAYAPHRPCPPNTSCVADGHSARCAALKPDAGVPDRGPLVPDGPGPDLVKDLPLTPPDKMLADLPPPPPDKMVADLPPLPPDLAAPDLTPSPDLLPPPDLAPPPDTQPCHCKIAGKCYKSGATAAQGCKECDPTKSTTAWTLAKDGAACDKDALNCTNDACAKGFCKHTPISGFCAIGGKCYAKGDVVGGCSICYPKASAIKDTGITTAGCCDTETLYYCDSGSLKSIDCLSSPKCGWNATKSFYDCKTGGGVDPSGKNPKGCD